MPSTINGLIIFIVVLLPGVPGERLYNSWTGLDWRENKLQRTIRIVSISIAGLVPYIIAAHASGLPLPLYIFPETYTAITGADLVQIAWAYTGHTGFAITAAAVGGYLQDWMAEQRAQTTYPSAWDDLVRDLADGRWIVVALKNGDVFLGGLQEADINAPREDRDLILSQPARYSDYEGVFQTGLTVDMSDDRSESHNKETPNGTSARERDSSQLDRKGVARPDQPDKPPTAESGGAPTPPPSSARPVRPNGETQSGSSEAFNANGDR